MSTAREIVDALGGTWNGTSGKAHCPAHDDQNPSLSVTQDGDRVLCKCFAGCSQGAVISALRGKGLWNSSAKVQQPTDAQDKAPDPQPKDSNVTLPTATWLRKNAEYKTRSSVESYLRNRGISGKLPKNLGQVSARQLGDLGYSPSAPGMVAPIIPSHTLDRAWNDRPKCIGCQLTRLKQLSDGEFVRDQRNFFGKMGGGVVPFGGKPGELLLIAEGVETALSVFEAINEPTWAALSTGNMPAICIPAQVEVVVVCADNDEAGRNAGKTLAERVAGLGKTALLAIPDDDGADWNDALVTHGEEHCRDAILNAPEVDAPETFALRVVTAGELLDYSLPVRTNLLSPWLEAGGLAMIHAPRGVGKTWVALGIACAVATGGEFLGWNAPTPVEVLYIDGELAARLLQDRLGDYRSTFGEGINDGIRLLTPDLQPAGIPDLSTEAGQAQIEELILPSTGLIIIDSISTVCRSGVENEAESWLPIQNWALKQRAQGRSVLFVHHSGKTGKQRGTSRREDVLDAVIGLRRADDYSAESGAEFEVVFEKNRSFYGQDAAPFRAKIETENGQVNWTVNANKQMDRLEEIAKLLADGLKQKEIAAHFNLTAGRVNQLVKEARQEGLIDDKAA